MKLNFPIAYINPIDEVDVPAPKLWDAHNISSELASVNFDQTLTRSGTCKALKKLTEYGFLLVKHCPCERASVAKFANTIGYIRETIFGGLWEFEANETMADSAYTPKELRPHTDSTYSLDAPGLQILLVLYDATVVVCLADGFRVANQLQQDDPILYAALGQIEVTGIYKGMVQIW